MLWRTFWKCTTRRRRFARLRRHLPRSSLTRKPAVPEGKFPERAGSARHLQSAATARNAVAAVFVLLAIEAHLGVYCTRLSKLTSEDPCEHRNQPAQPAAIVSPEDR